MYISYSNSLFFRQVQKEMQERGFLCGSEQMQLSVGVFRQMVSNRYMYISSLLCFIVYHLQQCKSKFTKDLSLNNETLMILGMYVSSSQFENKAFISAQLATQFESMIKVFKISYQGKKRRRESKIGQFYHLLTCKL